MVRGMMRATIEQNCEDLLASARAHIARAMLSAEEGPSMLGTIALHAHQRTAVARLRKLLRLTNGALLADGTGLGKTFVALSLAAEVNRALVIAPSSLLDSWQRALTHTGVRALLVSMERLSRSSYHAAYDPELVILDESHH